MHVERSTGVTVADVMQALCSIGPMAIPPDSSLMACVNPNCPGCESCQDPRTWGKVFKEIVGVYTSYRAPECGDGTLYIRMHDLMEDARLFLHL
jgi:hypothetical protein